MAHQIERVNGVDRMFAVVNGTLGNEAPWHGLGQQVETEQTWEGAQRQAGLDWEVEKRRIGVISPVCIDRIPVIQTEVDTHMAIVRKGDNKVLGVVSSTYEPIQNREVFDFLDTLIGDHLAVYNTAGSLCGGRKIFVSAKFSDGMEIGDYPVDKYLLATSAHDGSGSLLCRLVSTRVVCMNTLEVATHERTSQSIKIKHTKNWRDKETAARRILKLSDIYFANMKRQLEQLDLIKIGTDILNELATELYPDTTGQNGKTWTRPGMLQKREELHYLFKHGKGIHGRTALDAYNAVVEQADHHTRYRVRTANGTAAESRFHSIFGGTAYERKQKALAFLNALA